MPDSIEGPEQQADFRLEGPDEDGCVWICSAGGRDVWCRNLGPAAAVAPILADWLGQLDVGDAEPDRPAA